MKKIMQRFLGIAAAAALIVTYAVPVMATSSGSSDGDTPITETPAADNSYTITLKEPENVEIESGSYGAYQIFSGTVPSRTDTVEEPGDNSTKLPITDIKWGNAFGVVTKDTATYESDLQKWQRNIVNFVYALATAYSDDAAINDHYQYAYAFKDFTDFKDFAGKTKNTLAAKYYIGVTGDPTIDDFYKVDFDKLAIEVADVLADTEHPKDHKWLQQFADILGGYANDPEHTGTYAANGYVNRYYASVPGTDDTYTITVPAGYYMIRDFSTLSAENSAYSARLLFVATNVEQTLKADIPTLEKNIVRDAVGSAAEPSSTKKNLKTWRTEAAGVGDVVTFKLTGTLPSDYINFIGGYTFEFKDILPDGLTLNKNAETGTNIDTYVTVEAEGWFVTDGGATTWDSSLKEIYTDSFDTTDTSLTHHHFTTADDKAYTSTLEKQTLTVNFPCLKEIVIKDGSKTYRLGYQDDSHFSKIYVTYTATVNSNALVYPSSTTKYNGNPNKAVLTYSDNPQAYVQTDQTTSKSATVYTYGAAITKVDAAEFIKNDGSSVGSSLGGAVFALVRKNPSTDPALANSYQIAEFALNKTIDDDSSFKGQEVQKVSEWNKNITVTDLSKLGELVIEALTPVGNENYKITSSTDTATLGALNISGLDVGVTYYLVEVAPPSVDTYATIDPFTLTLTAEIDDGEYTGLLADDTDKNDENDGIIMDEHEIKTGESLSIDKFVQVLNNDVPASTADKNGIAELIVANFKYVDLPSTGGTGTYIFYIIGGVVVAASLVLFFLSRKKTTK